MTGRNLEPQVIRYAQDCHGPQLSKNYELSAFKDPSVKALTSAVQSSCKSVVTTYSARTEPEIRTNKSSWLLQWYLLLQLLKHQMAKTCKYYIPLADKTQMAASWHPQGKPRIWAQTLLLLTTTDTKDICSPMLQGLANNGLDALHIPNTKTVMLFRCTKISRPLPLP